MNVEDLVCTCTTVQHNICVCIFFYLCIFVFAYLCICLFALQVPIQSGGNVEGLVCACATIQHSRASTWLTAATDIGFFANFITFITFSNIGDCYLETLDFFKKIIIQIFLVFRTIEFSDYSQCSFLFFFTADFFSD